MTAEVATESLAQSVCDASLDTEGNAFFPGDGARRFVILGAGVSGLSVAHGLLRDGLLTRGDTLVIQDAKPEFGGCLTATRANGFLLEHGAQGVLASRESFVRVCEETGLCAAAIGNAPSAKARYLISPELHAPQRYIRLSPPLFGLVRAHLLTAKQWLRALCEPFIVRARPPRGNETLFDFFARRFGVAFARRMAIPMATGIWAGGARRIFVGNAFPRLVEWETRYGSVLVGGLRWLLASKKKAQKSAPPSSHAIGKDFPKGLISFSQGMEALPRGLAHTVQEKASQRGVHFQWKLAQPAKVIESSGSRPAVDGEPSDVLIVAFPPYTGSLEWRHQDTQSAWEALRSLPHHGVAVVGLGGFIPVDFPVPEGFGALAPEESTGLLGVLHVHDMFPCHVPNPTTAPEGTRPILYRLLLGGDRDPALVAAAPGTLRARALAECLALKLVPPDFSPSFSEVVSWPHAIAVMGDDHAQKQPACSTIESEFPGVFLTGNYLSGVGVADCLLEAEKAVARIAEHLRQRPQKGVTGN
jgi:oxygen-dependent protoporphyrinogen oxidase